MPAGPFSLCLQARSFMPTGPLLLLLLYMLYCCLANEMLSLLSRNTARHFGSIQNSFNTGHVQQPSPGLSLRASVSPAAIGPLHRASAGSPSSLPAPQAVDVEEAPPGSLDSSFRYWLEAEEIPEVNAVIAVDACTQYSRPGSAAASPCPLVGVRIKAIITGAKPVFQAARHLPPSQSPPPLPLVYQDSTPRIRRRPPQSLIVRRPHTRSSPTDEPLLEPLLLDRY